VLDPANDPTPDDEQVVRVGISGLKLTLSAAARSS
jgi:hypothetical protein